MPAGSSASATKCRMATSSTAIGSSNLSTERTRASPVIPPGSRRSRSTIAVPSTPCSVYPACEITTGSLST
jgi:hypothetical protein